MMYWLNLDTPPLLADAILSLKPDAGFICGDTYESIVWDEGQTDLPTQEAIEAELERITTLWEESDYRRNRKFQYPSIGDQLDALYHAGVFPEEMAAEIAAVKSKYPKPDQA